VTDWDSAIELPTVLGEFYLHLGPFYLCITAGENRVDVPKLKRFWANQACRRWHGLTGKRRHISKKTG
jgi:hypothetical protein